MLDLIQQSIQLARVNAFIDLLDQLLSERGDVFRLSAGDDALVGDDLLIGPVRTRVDEVGLDAGPACDVAAVDGIRLGQEVFQPEGFARRAMA